MANKKQLYYLTVIKLKNFYFPFSLGLLLFLTSCIPYHLDVQTRYLSRETLASYHIGTPDPHLDNPTIGQRLLIQWSLSSQDIQQQPVFLYFIIRFRNHQQREMTIPIHTKRGFYLYDLIDQEYCESGGFQTYRVEIRADSCTLLSWKHPLWTDLITFDFSPQPFLPCNEQ